MRWGYGKREDRPDGSCAAKRRHRTNTDFASGQTIARLAQDSKIDKDQEQDKELVSPAGQAGKRRKGKEGQKPP